MTKLNIIYKSIPNKAIPSILSILVLILLYFPAHAQEQPPRPLQLTKIKDLNFGAFIPGVSGGLVIIDPQSSRSVTGSVIDVNISSYPCSAAIFEIKATTGTLITIGNVPPVTLTGPGGTLTMVVGASIPTSPFVNTMNPSDPIKVRMGGILTVGNIVTNPPGNYIGIFYVTFIQQ